jgi:hypothetical protein
MDRCGRKRSRPNLRHYPDIYLEGLRKTTTNLSQDSRSLGRVLKPRYSEYEAGVLTTATEQLSVSQNRTRLHEVMFLLKDTVNCLFKVTGKRWVQLRVWCVQLRVWCVHFSNKAATIKYQVDAALYSVILLSGKHSVNNGPLPPQSRC